MSGQPFIILTAHFIHNECLTFGKLARRVNLERTFERARREVFESEVYIDGCQLTVTDVRVELLRKSSSRTAASA